LCLDFRHNAGNRAEIVPGWDMFRNETVSEQGTGALDLLLSARLVADADSNGRPKINRLPVSATATSDWIPQSDHVSNVGPV